MDVFKIIGESKPNKIKLASTVNSNIMEISKRAARKLVDNGLIKIANPEILYLQL